MTSTGQRKQLDILISGAGIGGPVAAYWLAKAGHTVTVVERAPFLRKEGQTVDVRAEALKILSDMGLLDKVKELMTREVGVAFVDGKSQTWAEFPQSSESFSFTGEIEIVRGELAAVLCEASHDSVKYVFGRQIQSLKQVPQGKVEVTFQATAEGEEKSDCIVQQPFTFDVVIVAEGLHSQTRAMAFQEDVSSPVHSLNSYVVSFSMPSSPKTATLWANSIVFPGKKYMLSRPDGFGRQRISAGCSDFSDAVRRRLITRRATMEEQKAFFREQFGTCHWDQMPTILEGLDKADDLYAQEIAQVRCKGRWSEGNVVLIGDSAHCPSPITGMGTSSSIVGAYHLASCLALQPDNIPQALRDYESFIRPWIEEIQSFPSFLPSLMAPDSSFAIHVLYWITLVITHIFYSTFVQFVIRSWPKSSNTEQKRLALHSPVIFA